ncbi:phage holin family protein [Roseivivax sp. CAU 1761]
MAIFAYYEALLRRKVQGAVFSGLGLGLLLIGIGFLAIALWILLAELGGALFAAVVMGFLFLAAGFILLGVGRLLARLRAPLPAARATARSPLLQLVEGFVIGLEAGRRTKSRKD